MDWDTYYEKFYDWATSTQIRKLSSLTSFGASSEVAEVAQEYMDEAAASRLIKKAVAYGVQFTPEEIYDLSGCCNQEAMNVLLDSAKCRFTQEQLEDLWGVVDDDVLERAAARNHVKLFDDGSEEYEQDSAVYDEPIPAAPKIGFLQNFSQGLELLAHFRPPMPLIRDIAPVIVQTALRTMATAMGAGIMGMVISTAANLEVTKGTGAYNITGSWV